MPPRVIVIGAGIAGASAAFALTRKGAEVTIVDDAAPGQATAAGAGIIAPWGSSTDGPFYDICAAAAAFYPTVLEHLAEVGVTQTDYRRTGALYVHRDPAMLDDAENRIRPRIAVNDTAGDLHRLDPTETRTHFPVLAEDLSGLLITGGARVDGRTLRDGLVQGAQNLGARTISGHAQVRATAVQVGGQRLETDAVIIAAGAWTNRLLRSLDLSVPVAPQRGQIAHLRLPQVDTSQWPTVHPLSHHYLVAFDEGRIVAGATRETGSGFDARVTAAGQFQVLQDALGIAPGLAGATHVETRVGLRPLPDQLPVAGAVPGREHVYVATGYGAVGLTIGPLLGDALARSILGESAPELAAIAPRPHTLPS